MKTPRLPADRLAGNRLLCEAAASGDVGAVRALLRQGADPNGFWDPARMRPSEPEPFELPEDLDLPEEILAEMVRLQESMSETLRSAPSARELPLFCAAASGDASTVQALLDAGADVTRRDNGGRTALFSADSAEVGRLLLARGVSLEDRDEQQWTPLASAVSDGAGHRVRALLEIGADANATWDRGYTVFLAAAAAEQRDAAILHLLVEHGADPHAATELGYNALHAAVDVNGEANAEDSVRRTFACLLGLGVDLEAKNDSGHTPLARAVAVGTGVEVSVLCELGADPDVTTPVPDCGDEDEEVCAMVEVPLVFAAIDAAVGAADKLTALLAAGVDLAVVDDQGRSPRQRAEARLATVESWAPDQHTDAWIADARRCIALLR